MTNLTALLIAFAIALSVVLDLSFGWGGTLFLARRFDTLLSWLAFWR